MINYRNLLPTLLLVTTSLTAERSEVNDNGQELFMKESEEVVSRYETIHDLYEISSSLNVEQLKLYLNSLESRDGLSGRVGLEEEKDIFYSCWVQLQPEGAIEHLFSKNEHKKGGLLFSSVFNLWVEQAPLAAAAFFENNDFGDERFRAANSIALRWVESDPNAAVEWSHRILDGYDLYETIVNLAQRMSVDDPLAALALSDRLPPGSPRERCVTSCVRIWAEHDLEAALSWTEKLPPSAIKQAAYHSCLMTWAETEPIAALSFHEKLLPTPSSDSTTRDLAYMWIHQDPVAVIAYLEEITEPATRSNVHSDAIIVWSERDPEACAAYLVAKEDLLYVRYYSSLASAWVAKSPQGALAWAESLEASDVENVSGSREVALKAVLKEIVMTQPELVATYYSNHLTGDPRYRGVIGTVINAWGDLDGGAVTSWAIGLPGHTNHAIMALQSWATRAPVGAAELVLSFAGQDDYEPYALVLIDRFVELYPALAFKLACSLSKKGDLRQQKLEYCFRYYLKRDREAALAQLESLQDLAVEERALLNSLATKEEQSPLS